jgi:hypothetical protein
MFTLDKTKELVVKYNIFSMSDWHGLARQEGSRENQLRTKK